MLLFCLEASPARASYSNGDTALHSPNNSVGLFGTVIFDAQGLDERCETGKSGVDTSIPISIKGIKTFSKILHSGREVLKLKRGNYLIKLTAFRCGANNYSPVKKSVSVIVKIGKTSTAVLRFEDSFDREFRKLTHFDATAWNEKYTSDPLTYKIDYASMKDFALSFLCALISTGIDDYTLMASLGNEISTDQNVLSALLTATRLSYGCAAL